MVVDITENGSGKQAVQKSETALRESEFDNQIKTIMLDCCELTIGISHLETMAIPIYNNKYFLEELGWKNNHARTLIDAICPGDHPLVERILPEILARRRVV